jgi:hypothetical protein
LLGSIIAHPIKYSHYRYGLTASLSLSARAQYAHDLLPDAMQWAGLRSAQMKEDQWFKVLKPALGAGGRCFKAKACID